MPSSAASGQLAQICRHPIKSIGWETLTSVALTPDRTLPWDRHWALAHSASGLTGAVSGWSPKSNFVRGVAAAPLMAVRARLSEDGQTIALSHPDRPSLSFRPDTPAGSGKLVDWIAPLWPDTRLAPAGLVTAGPSQAMTDVEPPVVAILNLASLRDLSEKLGQDLSIHRWRGNLWIEGVPPWAEFDWIGRTISIGAVTLRIEDRITRCRATEGNPETGIADADTLGALNRHVNHQDFGVYARVLEGGHIALGDPVAIR